MKMIPPVVRYTKRQNEILGSMPKVRSIKFDFKNLPDGIGSRFDEKMLFFKESDVPAILDSVNNYINQITEPEENVIHDVHLVGIMPTEVGSQIAANMRLWDNVVSLNYAAPRRSESLIFNTNFDESVYESNIFPIKF
ncbi:MAG: hypothetical protein ABFD07_02905 [Methanobacterium sp.]